jgi:LemA protein
MIPGLITSVIISPIVLAGLYLAWMFNQLVGQRNRLREAWSGVDVQLKRRHDLVPNLVECVKGYREHERSLLENLARTRGRAQAAQGVPDTRTAENELTQDLRSVFVLAEAYPDLKASENFQRLSASLVEIEDNIQFARRYYTGSVRDYNNLVQSFPSLVAARLFNFPPAEFFEIETVTERRAPEVKL